MQSLRSFHAGRAAEVSHTSLLRSNLLRAPIAMAIHVIIAIGLLFPDSREYFSMRRCLLPDNHGNPASSRLPHEAGLIYPCADAAHGVLADFSWLSREG